MEALVVELEERVELAGAGCNVGGFPCVYHIIVIVVGPVPTVRQ